MSKHSLPDRPARVKSNVAADCIAPRTTSVYAPRSAAQHPWGERRPVATAETVAEEIPRRWRSQAEPW